MKKYTAYVLFLALAVMSLSINAFPLGTGILGVAVFGDTDNDGVLDTADAFPLEATESIDTDLDGIGNNADTDDDNDGVADAVDSCPSVANADQSDTDLDGFGDACDTDDNDDQPVFTFSFSGTQQEFLIPSGVNRIVVEVYGAQGGDPIYGGKGGLVEAVVDVTAGELLFLNVGGAGFGHDDRDQNGWNGGGRDFSDPDKNYTLTGGGASDIRLGGVALPNRIVVAGGGGQRAYPLAYGGAGGGAIGQDGPNVTSATGGTGGNLATGGLGGCGGSYCGGDGSQGQGGAGVDNNGHGGGGYYG
ncbi:glycine rich domain-containing protein, partial [Pseudomonadales bacterium]|nr:glycine rich domain-containing protein [Pseudomonadales bacterium]